MNMRLSLETKTSLTGVSGLPEGHRILLAGWLEDWQARFVISVPESAYEKTLNPPEGGIFIEGAFLYLFPKFPPSHLSMLDDLFVQSFPFNHFGYRAGTWMGQTEILCFDSSSLRGELYDINIK